MPPLVNFLLFPIFSIFWTQEAPRAFPLLPMYNYLGHVPRWWVVVEWLEWSLSMKSKQGWPWLMSETKVRTKLLWELRAWFRESKGQQKKQETQPVKRSTCSTFKPGHLRGENLTLWKCLFHIFWAASLPVIIAAAQLFRRDLTVTQMAAWNAFHKTSPKIHSIAYVVGIIIF